MADPLLPPSEFRQQSRKVARKAAHLTAREYLPMVLTIIFWAMGALMVGHADAARLLAATVLLRAIVMLADLQTIGPLRRRLQAPPIILRKSRRNAGLMQLASLTLAGLIVAAISLALEQARQDVLALVLPLVAIGLPARAYRGVDPCASSTYFRLVVSVGMLVAAAITWAIHGSVAALALAYGLREWIATVAIKLLPKAPPKSDVPTDEPLRFAEVARNTVVTSRRLLTYRLTKNILTIFGPFGNFAARTGRGLNWHNRLEPYMPHRWSGFVLFALATAAASLAFLLFSGKPAAMIVAAGLLQLSAIAVNILFLWRYLPRRDDPTLVVDDSEDE